MDEKLYRWYLVTVQTEHVDENTEKVKKIKENRLVKAVSITDAESQVVKDYEGMSMNYRIVKADESKIIQVMVPDGVDIDA